MIKLDGVWVGSINRAVLEAEAAESAPAPLPEEPVEEAVKKTAARKAATRNED